MSTVPYIPQDELPPEELRKQTAKKQAETAPTEEELAALRSAPTQPPVAPSDSPPPNAKVARRSQLPPGAGRYEFVAEDHVAPHPPRGRTERPKPR